MLKFFRSLFLLSFFAATSALAGGQPFDQATFDAMQKQGKPMLVETYADWCGTCKRQEPIISELLNTPALQQITQLRVDFDQQKDVLKALKVSMQSTLIVFKGGKEVGRSTGDTSKDSIAALLKKAI